MADDVIIGGVIIGGNDDAKILFRAIGSSLYGVLVSNPLLDPLTDQDRVQ
jgi:hypothetical protein